MPKTVTRVISDSHEEMPGRKPPKRRRVFSGPMLKHADFTFWAEQRGVEISSVRAEIFKGRGVGLQTTKCVEEGQRLLFIPEETMFKPNTELLKKHDLQRASSQARLTVSALFAFTEDSSYKAWMDSWPTRADIVANMPLNWDQALVELLPKSTKMVYERQKSDYYKDWLACQHAVISTGHSEADFKYFWLIVNSRSFHWAPPKGQPGYMVMCPFVDYMNHGPTGTGVTVIQRSDGYEVIANRDIKWQDEVIASYGAHSNDKLLVHYGFCLPSTATEPGTDDECRVDEQVLSLLSDSIQERLSDVGYLGPFALVPAKDSDSDRCKWEPCFKTQVAIRAMFQTCNEWEFFAENGEDLGDDDTKKVCSLLAQTLKPLQQSAIKRIVAPVPLDYDTKASPMSIDAIAGADILLGARWKQICDIVSAFGMLWDPNFSKIEEKQEEEEAF